MTGGVGAPVRIALALTVLVLAAAVPGSALADNPPNPTITVKSPDGIPTPHPDAAPAAPVHHAPAPSPAPVVVPTPAPRVVTPVAPPAPVRTPVAKPRTKVKPHLKVKKARVPVKKRPVVKPHASPTSPRQHVTRTVTVPAPVPAQAVPAKSSSSSPLRIGIFAGIGLILLLLILAAVRTTRAALRAAPPTAADAIPAAALAPAVVAPVFAPRTDEVQPNSIRADALPVVTAPPPAAAAPTADTLKILLWRGYGKSRFIARSGPTGPIVATSKAFRWREGKEEQTDAAIRAHAELLASLAQAGWRSVGYADSDPWYRVDLQRGSDVEIAPGNEPVGELSTPLPTAP